MKEDIVIYIYIIINITIYVHRQNIRREDCEDDKTYFGKRTFISYLYTAILTVIFILFFVQTVYTRSRTKSIDEQCVDCLIAWLLCTRERQLLLKIGLGKLAIGITMCMATLPNMAFGPQ